MRTHHRDAKPVDMIDRQHTKPAVLCACKGVRDCWGPAPSEQGSPALCTTPLGRPVVPDVYISKASSLDVSGVKL